MPGKAAYTWIARISAFTWGFAFIHLFKYILDNIYPFWSQSVSLSLFAYLMIFVVWLAYTLFFNFHPYKNKLPRIIYHILFTANALVFYIAMMKLGEKTYLNLYPLFFTLQFFIYFFLISSIFPALLPYRISVLAGILPGLITYPYIGNIYIDIFLPAVVYLMPLAVFATNGVSFSASTQRMLPLRKAIDLLRYLFLGLAFYGIFDAYRERFFITAFILATGPVMSNFFLLTDKKKHHIKYGIILLSIGFILSAALYSQISLTYWAAVSFCILTLWEGIYFKKTVEGDLKREQILSGTALVLSILFYGISVEWVGIISAVIVFLIQIRILVYISKGYRKTISILFGLSLLTWSLAIFASYSNSYKRDFLDTWKMKTINPPPSLKVLNLIGDKNTILATNLFPERVVKNFSEKYGIKIIPVDAASSTFLSTVKKIHTEYPSAVQVYSLKNLKPYDRQIVNQKNNRIMDLNKEQSGEQYFFKFVKLNNIPAIYLYDYDQPGQYHDARQSFPLSENPAGDVMPIETLYNFTKALSEWYLGEKKDEYALAVLKEMSTWYDSPVIYRQIADTYGILGDTQSQIEYRQKIYDKGSATNEDKNLLLELYFLSGDTDQANKLCEELMLVDRENIMIYMEWKYKILKRRPNRFQLETLANNLQYMTDNLTPDKISQKNILLQRIREDLKSNPQWEEIYKKEKSRQENITYPE